MALRLSTGLRNKMLGTIHSIAGITVSAVTATDTIADSGNTLLTLFRPGEVVLISGSSGGTNDGYQTVTSIASTGATMVLSNVAGNESANAALTITGFGKSWLEIFKDGLLDIYSGSQPTDADTIESGTKLCTITISSGAFTKGTATNGLEFGTPAAGVVGIKSGETWTGLCVASGTAGWFRFYDNSYITGASTTSIRFDGSVGTSGAQLNVSSTTFTTGATETVSTMTITLPAS